MSDENQNQKGNINLDTIMDQVGNELDKRGKEALKGQLIALEQTKRTHVTAIKQIETQQQKLIEDAKNGIWPQGKDKNQKGGGNEQNS